MTCDEAYTYQIFHGNSDPLHTANHHILNTYMMRAFSIVFGESKFVLRSPNLVAHLLFLFFGYLILTRLKKQWLVIAAYLSLNLNPFLLEFFSLARGYGLSMGFMTAGLWMFLMHLEKQTDQQKKPIQFLYGAFICAALAVLSNFMMTYFYVGLLSLYFFMEVRKSSSPKKIVIHLKKNAGFYFF